MFLPLRSAILIPILLVAGCDGGSEDVTQTGTASSKPVEFTVQSDSTLVNGTLSAIRHTLPGLNVYFPEMKNIHIEDNYWTSIVFTIPDTANIPPEYGVQGHNCFIEINKSGSAIKAPKSPCKSMALDKKEKVLDSDYWFYLDPEYLTYEPYDLSTLTKQKRTELINEYLKKLEESVNSVIQKKSWLPYDLPNFSRLFSQVSHEGLRFTYAKETISPYDSCRQVGMAAETWWQNQVFSLDDLASNDPAKVAPALNRIQDSFHSYQDKVVSCKKEIKS